jgi:hypothetical protein
VHSKISSKPSFDRLSAKPCHAADKLCSPPAPAAATKPPLAALTTCSPICAFTKPPPSLSITITITVAAKPLSPRCRRWTTPRRRPHPLHRAALLTTSSVASPTCGAKESQPGSSSSPPPPCGAALPPPLCTVLLVLHGAQTRSTRKTTTTATGSISREDTTSSSTTGSRVSPPHGVGFCAASRGHPRPSPSLSRTLHRSPKLRDGVESRKKCRVSYRLPLRSFSRTKSGILGVQGRLRDTAADSLERRRRGTANSQGSIFCNHGARNNSLQHGLNSSPEYACSNFIKKNRRPVVNEFAANLDTN